MDLVQKFLEDIEQDLILHNVWFRKPKTAQVYSADSLIGYSGYFRAGPDPELAVARKKPQDQWLSILVHEYCHFLQWKEKSMVWARYDELVQKYTEDPLDLYLKKDDALKDSTELFQVLKSLERDAEQRAVELIKIYNLPLDLNLYLKKARAYLLFYDFVKKHRRWYSPGQEPYNLPSFYESLEPSLENLQLSIEEERKLLSLIKN